MSDWRAEKATEEQLALIADMMEFSEMPIPVFTGTTKGEAADYINKWMGTAHESMLSVYERSGNG